MSWIPGLYKSPLRYPGGKGRIANYVKVLMLENGLVGRDYVEPYAGGASVALELLFEDYADVVHINDLNHGVFAFWQSVLTATEELCERVASTPVTMREWHRQREIARDPTAMLLDAGFATLFLNRTNRSGIISGGVIGGKEQSGEWKLDARFNRTDLIQRIRKIGRHRSRITLSNEDAASFLHPWLKEDAPSAFIYLDPPYFVKGRGLYDNFYGPEDHADLAALVRRLAHPWIVSYDAVPEILRLYEGFDAVRYSLSYSANTRGLGSEVMFFSPDITQADFPPSGVPLDELISARMAQSGLT